jgi:hypothetical protein
MDRQFLELWGNLLINASKGQKQIEDLTIWINHGFKETSHSTSVFRKIYGLDNPSDHNAEGYLKEWNKASIACQKSFNEYLGLIGSVSSEDYSALIKEHKALKQKAFVQEETIRDLRKLLDENGIDHGQDDTVTAFRKMFNRQTKQFQKLIEGLSKTSE